MDDEVETERTQVLFCEECGCEAHLGCEDDWSTTVVIFCPTCSIEV